MLCAAPTVLISIAHAPKELRCEARRDVRVLTAGAPPAATTIERIEEELGWVITHVYGLTETSPFITISEPRPEHKGLSCAERSVTKACQGVELLTSGELRIVDEQGNDVPRDGITIGEILVRGNTVMKGYYRDSAATAEAMRGGWFHRRCGRCPSRRLRRDSRSLERCDNQWWRKHFFRRGGRRIAATSSRAGGRNCRLAARALGRSAACICCIKSRRYGHGTGTDHLRTRSSSAL